MARGVRFLLDGDVRELTDIDPTLTVLNWLRYEARRTGTKEGCAEGDCGACTVVLGELDGESVRFRAVNACILFAPMLDGKALFTVESLAKGGRLHPVQQAMADLGGAQCGFCTPGFVMTLYAHYRSGGATDTQSLKDALAGNLCRCTGYGPILAAGQTMGAATEETTQLAQALKALRNDEPLVIERKGRRFLAPRTTEQFAEAVQAHPHATILAGGTDVSLWVTKGRRTLETVISLNGVDGLGRIEDLGDRLRIGAAVLYADALEPLTALHPEFGPYIRRLGAAQVRNAGTVCGNIANGSPIGDMPPALIAAGATLALRQGTLVRRLPLEAYFLDYGVQDRALGEFVEAVEIPKIAPDRLFRLFKLSKRFDQDISAVSLGVSIGLTDGVVNEARIAFGGMAATPRRAGTVETALIGRPLTPEIMRAAAEQLGEDFRPITDMRASADYRLQAAKNLLLMVADEAAGPAAPRLMALEPVDA
jgi:xanthine dehydrogenase small subunit